MPTVQPTVKPEPDGSDPVQRLRRAMQQVNEVILGKTDTVRLAFACLLANGHLLVEDLPGMGKTTLAHAMASTVGLAFQRIQFTSDLLPSDITGVSIYEPEQHAFQFHPGPLFAQLVMADEINRAMPKTQSALLEAMAEQQVTVDGRTHPLPKPFFVIATQNTIDFSSTFALPDSQLDRFLMRITLGYPSVADERALLHQPDRRSLLDGLQPQLDASFLHTLQQRAAQVRTAPALLDYVHELILATRTHAEIRVGLSPRAGLGLLRAAQAMALIAERDHVLPEDVQAVFVPVASHRLIAGAEGSRDTTALARAVLQSVRVD